MSQFNSSTKIISSDQNDGLPAHPERLVSENRLSGTAGLLPLSSLVVILIVGLFVYWLFTGDLYRFYASVVFLFYSWTHSMWISVIMLGVFQTILLIPLRIFRTLRRDNLKDMHEKIAILENPSLQQQAVKQSFSLGNRDFLFYLLDFIIQLTTFLTIGRLFLTDFYSRPLNPASLYSWVTYPVYPILDRFFKIPYPVITSTVDLGFSRVILVWLTILFFQFAIWIGRNFVAYAKGNAPKPSLATVKAKTLSKYSLGYFAVVFWLSWLLITHIPTGLGIRIFSGDVAFQNDSFNTLTAIVTFLTLLWFDANEIAEKKAEAKKANIKPYLIGKMGRRMFKESMITAATVGLGAYYITNQIPCAFELSIFTLELISLLSPLTLDKWIKKSAEPKPIEPPVESTPPVSPSIPAPVLEPKRPNLWQEFLGTKP